KELADRLLSLEIEREQNEAKLRTLHTASADAANYAKNLAQQATSLAAALRSAAEQLRLHLTEVPGNDEAVDRLRTLAAKLLWPSDTDDMHATAQSLNEFLAICNAAHDQTTRIRVTDADIFTATGKRERIHLLAIGHVRFAYVTVDGDRVGIALSSAAEASGYRWTEDVDAQTQQLVRDAIERCTSAQSNADGSAYAAVVAVPLDPTGRLTVEAAATGESSLYDWCAAGGLVMIPLVCVAAVALALIVERAIFFFGRNRNVEKLAASVLAACRADQFDEAEQICSRRRGVVPRVLSACLARRPLGQRAMEDSIQEQLLHELPKLQCFMGALATLAGVAPLLGLLGTVTGIIATFSVIRSFGNTNPSLMAGGISEALVTTALGLLIAVPVVIAHSLLRSRSDRIVADAERHSATLLTALVHRPPESRLAATPEPPSRQHTAPRIAKELTVDV
ncbi:MAG: MotA/TolQ/ExbB proton channel family protein, partial [Pirellulales bacterium]